MDDFKKHLAEQVLSEEKIVRPTMAFPNGNFQCGL